MSTTSPFVIPSAAGSAALDDLSRVPWDSLKHAYGRGVFEARIRDIGTGLPRVLHLSVDGCLRDLVSEDATVRDDAVKHGLFGTVLHQGTLYEASAHALPFLAAIAADPGVAARAMILTGVADIVRFALLRPRPLVSARAPRRGRRR